MSDEEDASDNNPSAAAGADGDGGNDAASNSPSSPASTRSNGNGRYNLRQLPSRTTSPNAQSPGGSRSGGGGGSRGEPGTFDNDGRLIAEDFEARPAAAAAAAQNRAGRSVLQNQALRSVLQLLAGLDQEGEDYDDDDDLVGGEEGGMEWDARDVRVDEMLFLGSDDEDEDDSYDEVADETAASIGVAHVLSSMRMPPSAHSASSGSLVKPKPTPEMVQSLQESDFSRLTRERLGLGPATKTVAATSALNSLENPKASTSSSSSTSQEPIASSSASSLETDKSSATTAAQPETVCPNKQFLPRILADREIGGFRSLSSPFFSAGCQCRLMGNYLPNHCQKKTTFTQKLFCGSYSNCGDLFMSACQDQKIRLFDTTRGQFEKFRTIQAQNVGWSVLDTALSPDKRHLIYSSWCEDLHQVSLCGPDGTLLRDEDADEEGAAGGGSHTPLPLNNYGSRFCVFSLRFSHDGDEVLCGANDGLICLYDRTSNSRTLRIEGHDDDVNAVSFVDSATHILASGGDDGLCKIWDRRALRESHPVPVGTLAGHLDGITYIDPRGDGRHLITNSKDQTIKLWDIRNFSSQNAIEKSRQVLCNRSWDYRWQTIPRKAQKKVLADDTSVMTYRGHVVLRTLIRAKFSPVHTTGQRYIYAGSACGGVYIFDALTGNCESILQGHSSCVRDSSWHPYLPEIVTSSWDFSLCRWTYKERIENSEKKTKGKKASSKNSSTQLPRRSKRARTLRTPRL